MANIFPKLPASPGGVTVTQNYGQNNTGVFYGGGSAITIGGSEGMIIHGDGEVEVPGALTVSGVRINGELLDFLVFLLNNQHLLNKESREAWLAEKTRKRMTE